MQAKIVLRENDTPTAIRRENVHFTFASGVFGYDCVSCEANCCRGFSYTVQVGSELDQQLAEHPEVRFFADRPDPAANHVHINNCPSGCFFLTGENQCGIEREYGHQAKPETCRLFPFNNIRRVGSYLIVGPHYGLCPLQVVTPPDVAEGSSHSNLLDEMSLHGVTTSVPSAVPIECNLAILLELERKILSVSERNLVRPDYIKFVAEQISASRQVFDGSPFDREEAKEEVLQYRASLFSVLGVGEGPTFDHDETLARTMVAMTPYLRSILIFQTKEDTQLFNGLNIDHVPRLMLALQTLVALAMDAGMGEVTFQSVSSIFIRQKPLLVLLSMLDTGAECEFDPPVQLTFPGGRLEQAGYLRVLKALVGGNPTTQANCLGTILCENLPDHGLDRVVFLKNFADRVVGRIVATNTTRHRTAKRKHIIRSKIQRFGIAKLNHNLLLAAAERQASKQDSR